MSQFLFFITSFAALSAQVSLAAPTSHYFSCSVGLGGDGLIELKGLATEGTLRISEENLSLDVYNAVRIIRLPLSSYELPMGVTILNFRNDKLRVEVIPYLAEKRADFFIYSQGGQGAANPQPYKGSCEISE